MHVPHRPGLGVPAAELAAFGWEALRAAWDDSPALVGVTVGPQHVLVYVNRAVEKVFGGRPTGVPIARCKKRRADKT